MSLVNDALKKARLEAARQDAARRGLPLPGAQLATGAGPSSQTLLRVGAVAVVVILALVLFLVGRRLGSVDAAQTAVVGAGTELEIGTGIETGFAIAAGPATAPTPAGPPEVVVRKGEPPTRPAPRSEERATTSAAESRQAAATRPEPPTATSQGVEPEPTEPDTVSSDGAGAPPPTPADRSVRSQRNPQPRVRIVTPGAPAERPATDSPRTVVRTLELPGGVRIELGGIAWSEQRPFALVNGRVVGPGDTVESLAVVAIAQRHVELQGEAGHFLLKLK